MASNLIVTNLNFYLIFVEEVIQKSSFHIWKLSKTCKVNTINKMCGVWKALCFPKHCQQNFLKLSYLKLSQDCISYSFLQLQEYV